MKIKTILIKKVFWFLKTPLAQVRFEKWHNYSPTWEPMVYDLPSLLFFSQSFPFQLLACQLHFSYLFHFNYWHVKIQITISAMPVKPHIFQVIKHSYYTWSLQKWIIKIIKYEYMKKCMHTPIHGSLSFLNKNVVIEVYTSPVYWFTSLNLN